MVIKCNLMMQFGYLLTIMLHLDYFGSNVHNEPIYVEF